MAGHGRSRVAFAVLSAQLRDRPLRLLVTIGAIALGIALTAGVYLVNASALAEFARATRALTGAADLVIDGGRAGFGEELYGALASRPEVAIASPVLEVDLALAGGGTLPVLGVDPFVAGRLQPALYADLVGNFVDLLPPRAIALSAAAARSVGIGRGDTLKVRVGSEELPLQVVAVLPETAYGRRLGVMDIGSAQWTLGRLGRLSRIELRLASGVEAQRFAASLRLPPGTLAATPAVAEARAATLTRAYRVNLNMLALVALLTGAFLVFATQALGTLRRRPQFALLRALGVRRGEIEAAVLLEGALVGAAGGALGTGLGWLIAALVLVRFGGDLGAGFFDGAQVTVEAAPAAVAAFVCLGVVVAVAGSWLPARRVAAVAPATALKGGDPELAGAARRGGHLGLALLLSGAAVAFLPPVAGLPVAGYLAVALLLFGAILLVPAFAAAALGVVPAQRSAIARLALARLQGTVVQSSVSLAAIVVSFSLMVAMAIMVHSFRDSFERWLGQVLPADMYLRIAPASDTTFLGPAAIAAVAGIPGVAHSEFRRLTQLALAPDRPPVTLIARPLGAATLARLPWVVRAGTLAPGRPVVYVSEAMGDLYGLTPGSRFDLPVGGRVRQVLVGGVWRDYARSTGTILVDRDTYQGWTGDEAATEGLVWLAPGYTAQGVGAALRARLGMGESLQVVESTALKERSLRAFDRAFAITYALEAIAVGIGLAGVAVAFGSQALARRAEFGVLRHVGCSRRQIRALLALEGALLGGLGAAYGLLVGTILSLVLVYVVNRQSFHWSLDFVVPVGQLALVSVALVLAAAATARVAARAALGEAAVRAVREDW
ncbi:MAG TPA: FtsX-like permease family protein [Steroidobacteraceae bacterium]|nr:FtsX-like permease family protein [Steroidobacteraceae bacterium]